MSTPTRRLEVQDIPGYRLYWFREANAPRAVQAAYEFVNDREARLFNLSIGDNPGGLSGNTDLGSRVSIVAGTSEHGQPERLILMKIKLEFFQDDQKAIAEKNARQMSAIFEREEIAGADGTMNERGNLVYVDRKRTALLNRGIRKAKIGR